MPLRHILLAVLVAAVWGCNFIAIRVGLDSMPPLLFSAARFIFSGLPILLVPRPPVPWSLLIGVGLGIGVVQFGFLFSAMHAGISPGLASLVLQTQAFFTALFAIAIDGISPRPWQWWGLAVAFAGIGLIGASSDGSVTLAGLLLVLVAAAGWASGNLVLRRVRGANMVHFMIWMSVVPPLPLYGFSLWLEGPGALPTAWHALGWSGLAALLYIAIFATWFGYGVWGWLMQQHAVTLIAPFSLLVPLFGMLGSALAFGEQYGPLKLAAAALVLLGLLLNVFGGRLPWWRRTVTL